jgi:predicted DNA-binding protein
VVAVVIIANAKRKHPMEYNKKNKKTTSVKLRIDEECLSQLKELSDRDKVGMSTIIRNLIKKEYYEKLL